MKRAFVALAILVVLVIAGCTTSSPLDVTENAVGTKVGQASGSIMFGGAFTKDLVVDNSIQTAAKNGGITKIATVDYRVTADPFGGVFTWTGTTIVTGE
jgi:hypothetical protein